jgi:glycosyltransferase involved in cell wall biosynthesis
MPTMTLSAPPAEPSSQVPPAAAGYSDVPPVILIAPNASEQMGGEAIKALQIALELTKRGIRVRQVTHERVRTELSGKYPQLDVTYIPETRVQALLWKSIVGRPLLKLGFQWKAAKVAGELLKADPTAIVHYTSPVSPVLPAFRTAGARTVWGPINGSIFYPPGFRHRESWTDWFRRVSHGPLQLGHRLLFRGKQSADALLVAGGERTYRSLRLAGCRDAQFVDSVDSGILDRLYDLPRATHAGTNLRFVHNGRLVDHKGTDLVIRALAQTKNRVELTVIGRGPEKAKCELLAAELKLGDRITFIEWIKDHSQVATTLQQFRAFVFPSLAEANGIVVQEAMLLGVPVIALDWGGPALLVTPETGILIQPTNEATVVAELAAAMDRLATDGELAERFSAAGRARAVAEGYRWQDLIERWIGVYRRVAAGQRVA